MNKPYTLSVVMIVKNEADNLATSLPALQGLADEIVILDSGSTDASAQIAAQHGAKWHVNTDWPGFGRQRQLAQSHATGDWILALDADEELTDELRADIARVVQTPPGNTVYGMRRIDCVFGQEIDSRHWRVKSHWRLYPRRFGYDNNLVHESVVLDGAQTQTLRGYARHHTAPTPRFWLDKRLAYAKAWANDRHQRGKKGRFASVLLNPAWAFFKQYLLDGRFLKGRYGLVYALLFAQYTFNKYACLYDLSHNRAEQAFEDSVNMLKTLRPVDLAGQQSSLSLVMIVKNESKHLAACLETAKDLASEIVLLDSGSTDTTPGIAAQYGAKWHVNTHWQGFGRQRQLAQTHASGDYVLVMDADERLDQAAREAIAAVLRQPVQTDKVFSLARVNTFCGVEVQPRWWYADKLARLYANAHYRYSDLEVHESLDQQGRPAQTLPGYLEHITNDDLHHFMLKNVRYSHDWAYERFKKGRRVGLLRVLFSAQVSFLREYVLRLSALGGAYGYIQACAATGYTLDKYLMLWHMGQQARQRGKAA